jgi:hypothetical protein
MLLGGVYFDTWLKTMTKFFNDIVLWINACISGPIYKVLRKFFESQCLSLLSSMSLIVLSDYFINKFQAITPLYAWLLNTLVDSLAFIQLVYGMSMVLFRWCLPVSKIRQGGELLHNLSLKVPIYCVGT